MKLSTDLCSKSICTEASSYPPLKYALFLNTFFVFSVFLVVICCRYKAVYSFTCRKLRNKYSQLTAENK